MASVRVSPWNIEFDVEPGESVFDASFRGLAVADDVLRPSAVHPLPHEGRFRRG